MYDELALDTVGDEKTALFIIISDTDASFNFLVSIAYTQLFNLLCEKADDFYGGRLPFHVRCLIDEAANIGQIPNLEKLMATIRSREISACLVLQAQSQLTALYKDHAQTIAGNCDSAIFLGGKEKTTLEEWSKILGKETIDSYSNSETKGNSPSFGKNYQKLGKDLMSMDELAVMDGFRSACCSFAACVHFFQKSTTLQNIRCTSSLPIMTSAMRSMCKPISAPGFISGQMTSSRSTA